ncbi:nephrin-like [Diadema setosum]|uniref:nephrin-like n=1 Tax=Diadema setosum TaxID=31175 RepID=UPI003B3A935D
MDQCKLYLFCLLALAGHWRPIGTALGARTTITTQPEVTAVEGGNVVLTCTYAPRTSSAEFGYLTWSKDNQRVATYECGETCEVSWPDATPRERYDLSVDRSFSGNLTIYGVDLDDEAVYSCSLFTSDLVLLSSDTQLTVNVPPRGVVISDYWANDYENNSSVQVQVGQSYQLRCAIISPVKPGVTITWESDGIDISMSDQVDVATPSDSPLISSSRVVEVTPTMGDADKTLRCLASHPSSGIIISSTVRLDVQVCPSSVVVHECPTSVTAGDSATLGCRSAATSPPPNLYWLYDGVSMSNRTDEFSSGTAEDGSSLLTYTRRFEKQDFGKEFVCCIERTSMCDQLCSDPCRPNVKYPPSNLAVNSSQPLSAVTEGTRNLDVTEGTRNVEMTCWADGNPMSPDNIRWVRVDEAGHAEGSSRNTLRFDRVSRSDAGLYRCTVDNGVGPSSSVHTKILVHHAPNVTNEGRSRVHGNEGDATTLNCVAEAYPKPTITWYSPDNRTKGGSEVMTSILRQTDYSILVSSLLHISNIDPAENYGDYRCEARNDNGVAISVIKLSGITKPSPPLSVSIDTSRTTSKSLTVDWVAGYNGGALQSFTVKACMRRECIVYSNISGSHFEIVRLRPFTRYQVMVKAVNDFGESDYTTGHVTSTAHVVALYDFEDGGSVVTRSKSNQTHSSLPADLCFRVEYENGIGGGRTPGKSCVKFGGRIPLNNSASSSRLWIVSCGNSALDACSEADRVLIPTPAALQDPQENAGLSMTTLVAIAAGAAVCVLAVVIVIAAWHWNRKRAGSSVWQQKSMRSRRLPTLPRTNGTGPPSPSCQEVIDREENAGVELYSVNPSMHPYAQLGELSNTHTINDGDPNRGSSEPMDINRRAPPSAEDVQRNHLEGTYTTSLSYVPMNSPSCVRVASQHNNCSSNEPEFLTSPERCRNSPPDLADDVATGLLVNLEDGRTRPSEDLGYYSVPKGTRAAELSEISETTPSLLAVD